MHIHFQVKAEEKSPSLTSTLTLTLLFKEPKMKIKNQIGKRFKIFRQSVGKSIIEFSSEISLPIVILSNFEEDDNFNPGFSHFINFYKRYGLNGNWLLTGEGNIFLYKGPQTPDHAFQLDRVLETNDPCFSECLQIINNSRKSRNSSIDKEKLLALLKEIEAGNHHVEIENGYEDEDDKDEGWDISDEAELSDKEINTLDNAFLYSVESVYIILEEDHFRLTVFHRGKVLVDRQYPELYLAKLSFEKLFRRYKSPRDVQQNWTGFYHPDKDWMDSKLMLLESSMDKCIISI
jgi:transcriptional regulator with XRE-family HTH domain